MSMNPEKKRKLNDYLDDVFPQNPREPHPFTRFRLHEIVRHAEFGTGIVTGYRIPDLSREIEGLGVQFVDRGRMGEHRVFTPRECATITGSGIEFNIKTHAARTLEEIWDEERHDR